MLSLMDAALFLLSPKELDDLTQHPFEWLDIQQRMHTQSSLYLGHAWQSYHEVLNRYSAEPIPVLNYVIQAEHALKTDLNLPEALRYNSISKVSSIYQALNLIEVSELKRRYQHYLRDQATQLRETDELSLGEFRLLYRDLVELYRIACLNNQLLCSIIRHSIPPQPLV